MLGLTFEHSTYLAPRVFHLVVLNDDPKNQIYKLNYAYYVYMEPISSEVSRDFSRYIPNDIWQEIISILPIQSALRMCVSERFTELVYISVRKIDFDSVKHRKYYIHSNTDSYLRLWRFTRLTELNISNHSVFCKDIAKFTSLTSLSASNNLGLGNKDICGLVNLTHLNISGTCINDEGISSLTNLVTLTACAMYNDGITNAGVRDLVNLQYLRTDCDKISDLSACDQLQKLYVDDNTSYITGESLRRLTALVSLKLRHNDNVTDDDLSIMTNLRELSLCSNGTISDIGICTLTNLTSLDVSYSNINDISHLHQLVELKAIDSAIMCSLASLTNLTTLIIGRLHTRDYHIEISRLTTLTSLVFEYDTYTSESIRGLVLMRNLDIFYAAYGHWDISHMPNLETIYVHQPFMTYTGGSPKLRVIDNTSDIRLAQDT